MLKALIADDDEIFSKYVKKCVDWESQYTELLGRAKNGSEAMKMISDMNPDIVIMDVEMPEMSGLECIEQMRAGCSQCQFILVTGHDKFEYAQLGAKFGITDILLKPVAKTSLDLALQRTVNEYWMNRLSQLTAKNLMDASYVVDISAILKEDAPEQSVLGLCKKLSLKLNDNSLDGVRDILMQYVHCIENHGISQGRNIWLYYFPALICLDKLQSLGADMTPPFDSKLNLFNLVREGMLKEEVETVLLELCLKAGKATKTPSKGRRTAEEIYSMIMQNYHDPHFSVVDLANMMHFHEGYVRRVFKDAYGKSPNAALKDIRMLEAKKLLTEGRLQIQQVARQVGFDDASYFSKCFKNYFGHSPSERIYSINSEE